MDKVLELFAGRQCFTNVAKELGFNTFTSDINDLEGIDYVVNILDFDVNRVPFIPDIIWASPDCSTWSKAAGNIHFDRHKLIPKTEKARIGFLLIDRTIEIIHYFLSINPFMKYYIENPVGKLQKYLLAGTLFSVIPRLVTIDQCQYGRKYKKPTHIFTNDYDWRQRKRCPGLPICSHAANVKNAGTGMKTSLGVLKNLRYYERAKIPYELCFEILTMRNIERHCA